MPMPCMACHEVPCLTHCIWCWVDCDAPDPQHLANCPQRTGLYPADGEGCCDCDQPVGEFYALVPEGDLKRVVCLPCAAAATVE